MAIYKIWHPASHDIFAKYIATDMTANQVADIATGLQFFVEEYTEYGNAATVDENTVSAFLCTFFGCTPVSADAWLKEHGLDNAADVDEDTLYGAGIDLFSEREWRCGNECEQYIGLILPYQNTPIIQALIDHFNDESCLTADTPFEFHYSPAHTD